MNFTFVSPKEVAEKLLRKESFFILDVRNKEALSDWKIEGSRVEHLNVPYFDLIDGIEKIDGQVPKDQDVLVVCAKQGSSEMVAQHLVDAGFERVLVLKGGMKAWSKFLHPVKIGDLKE